MQRRLSTLAIIIGMAILFFLGMKSAHGAFYSWLGRQNKYIVSEHVTAFEIPLVTPISKSDPTPSSIPSLAPTLTPIPTPTLEPEPIPAVRIIIPKIGVNAKIVEVELREISQGARTVYAWDVPAYAVGHHDTSAYPTEQDNIVLTGHNNTLGQVFRRLDALEPGDEIFLYTVDDEYAYTVESKDKVLALGAAASDIAKHSRYTAPTSEETLTLVSCWPWATYTHRIYIVAKPKPDVVTP
jgi:LPXTG-site transpeptidase (sortase) family protein